MRAGVVSVAALLALAILTGAVSAHAGPRPAARFGVIDAHDSPDAARALGLGWERITFDWARLQPGGSGDFDLDAVDPAWLADAADAGREVVGLIVNTPGWASESGRASAVPQGLDLPPDDPANVWGAFAARLAAHYGPLGVHRWIIYDEPDVRPSEGRVRFEGEVADYARLVTVAAEQMRAADPQAVIHLGALQGWTDTAAGREPYLARLLHVLSADPDAVAHGFYFDVATVRVFNDTQAVLDRVTAARAALDAAGLPDKAIWLETNASPTLDGGQMDAPIFGVTGEQQADFVVQAAALALAAGVERIGVYRLVDAPDEDQPWGLVRADGSPRPAFDAYRTVIDLFGPTLAAAHYPHTAAELIGLEQPGRVVWVMWARDTMPVQFILTVGEVGARGRLYSVQGRAGTIQAARYDWPAAFTVETGGAQRDPHGFLVVGGPPQMLALDRGEFFNVGYVVVDGARYRVK